MIRGQAADITADNENINAGELDFIQMNKTAALIICSLRCGALLSSADGESLRKITKLGELIGIAFQIKDDILDITSTPEELGKTTGKDVKQNKATYPAVHGMKKAEDDLTRMSGEAMKIAGEFDKNIPWLYYIVEYLLKRRS
jgi:geranylgeranyl diphosphate synthase type II